MADQELNRILNSIKNFQLTTQNIEKEYGTYAVDTYQIRVPCGDCSIHLVVEKPPPPPALALTSNVLELRGWYPKNPEKRGKIVSAVVVDGGHDGTPGAYGKASGARIQKTIDIIQRTYTIPGDKLKFDSWLVTHWDRDHYCGFLYLILEDLQNQKANANQNTQAKSSFFKYEGETCKSTLFCPVFDKNDWKNKHACKGAHYTLQKSDEAGHVDILLYSSINPLSVRGTKTLEARFRKIFKKVDGFKDLAGRNFFCPEDDTHQYQCTVSTGNETVQSLLEDTKNSSPTKWPKEYPKFLCIGAEGCIIAHADNPPDPRNDKNLLMKGPTLENYISIFTLIVWPASGRVSMLMAGDAYHTTESKLRDFLKGPTGVPIHVPVMKASHHGAISSTPPDLLHDIKPQKIIISAGREYGHPSWPLIMFLSIYWRRLLKKNWSCFPDEKLVFPLRFPYYLAANFNLGTIKQGLRPADLNYSMLQAINGHIRCQPELKFLQTRVVDDIDFEQGEIEAMQRVLFLQPKDTADSGNSLFSTSLTVGWNFDAESLKEMLNNEPLALVLAFQASQQWKEQERKKAKAAALRTFEWQALLIQMLTWYWSRISRVENLWDDRIGQDDVPFSWSMEHLWIRSSDSDILDGRVHTVPEGRDGLPIGSHSQAMSVNKVIPTELALQAIEEECKITEDIMEEEETYPDEDLSEREFVAIADRLTIQFDSFDTEVELNGSNSYCAPCLDRSYLTYLDNSFQYDNTTHGEHFDPLAHAGARSKYGAAQAQETYDARRKWAEKKKKSKPTSYKSETVKRVVESYKMRTRSQTKEMENAWRLDETYRWREDQSDTASFKKLKIANAS